jgi:PAS domain S-box-containing protein
MKKSSRSYTFPYVLLGFGFGLILVLIGTVVALLTTQQPLTFENMVQAHLTTPLLWVLDAVPFLLAGVLGVLGSREGKLMGLQQESRDVQRRATELSRLNTDLEKKEKEYQDIEAIISRGKREWEATFDSVQDFILLTDDQENVIRCNRAAAQAFHLDFPEIIGKPLSTLFYGEGSLEQMPAQHAEVKFPTLDGWYEVSSNALTFEGAPHGKIFVARNVTDRKQTALDLERQKQFYEALVKNSPIAIVTLSLEQKVVACNPAFEEMFGYSQQEVLGQNIDNLISPLELLEESQSFTQFVGRGQEVHKLSQRRRKDGSLVDVELFGIPVVLWGKQIGILGMYHDISDLVQARIQTESEPVEEEPAPVEEGLSPLEKAAVIAPFIAAEEAEPQELELEEEPIALPTRQRLIKIETIEGIGPIYAAKLGEIGIVTTEDLLAAGATRKGRQDLVKATEISDKLILKWVNRADLMRVPGIGEEYSDLLEVAGVDTVKELRNRNPNNLFTALQQANEEKHLVRRVPHLSEVEAWVSAAKELEVRLTY